MSDSNNTPSFNQPSSSGPAPNYYFFDSHDKKVIITPEMEGADDDNNSGNMSVGNLFWGLILIGLGIGCATHSIKQPDANMKLGGAILSVVLISAGVYLFLSSSSSGYENGKEYKSDIFSKRPHERLDYVYDNENEFQPFITDNCTSLKPLSDDQTDCIDFHYSQRRKDLNLTDVQYSNLV